MNSKRLTNRLAGETSPYLLQHAHNPVDWYPWGQEAFEKARTEDRPVLVSIGYAACHWCHVMETESFEDEETAALMNEHFVSIKVDREERPDVDAIYMDAVQAMTGGGGWPLTAFLTPEGEPFYAGTYFPKEDRHGLPAFRTILTTIAEAGGNAGMRFERRGGGWWIPWPARERWAPHPSRSRTICCVRRSTHLGGRSTLGGAGSAARRSSPSP